MISYNFQLNNTNETKTLNEMIEETFSIKKPIIDVSFFYNEKNDLKKIDNTRNTELCPQLNKKKH